MDSMTRCSSSISPRLGDPQPTHDSDALATLIAPNCTAWACIEMQGLEPVCADSAPSSQAPALAADGLCAGLELVEDLQGALVIGRYNSNWHSIKRCAEMFEGLWHAPLFQEDLGKVRRGR
jgi:hypothetical protein